MGELGLTNKITTMKKLVFLFLVVGFVGCASESEEVKCSDCHTPAVVKDLTGLDGCGLVFELANGTRLQPERRTYIQAPKPEEDPLYYFELKVGDSVRISYQETSSVSTCMVGKVVFVTCIKSCKAEVKE
jgi:hypothetical protein